MEVAIAIAFLVVFLFGLYMISPLLAPKQMNLMGMHVVITGGSYGIGFAVAREAFSRGAKVSIMARKKLQLQEAVDAINSIDHRFSGQKVRAVAVDVTDAAAVSMAMQEAVEHNGAVDVLVNCAGKLYDYCN